MLNIAMATTQVCALTLMFLLSLATAATDPHMAGIYPITRVVTDPSLGASFVASIKFFTSSQSQFPQTVRQVNLTIDTSCNQLILSQNDCFSLNLQDTCSERSIACNSTGVCGTNVGEAVFPSTADMILDVSTTMPDLQNMSNITPLLCSSNQSPGFAGLAPYRLSLVVQSHANLEYFNAPRVFGYCLGKPNGIFFVGQPEYAFGPNKTIAPLTFIPTLRWDRDVLPILALTGIGVYGGGDDGVGPSLDMASLDPSIFSDGLYITASTNARYLALVDPAYNWLRNKMTAMATGAGLNSTKSPFRDLDLCFKLRPGMSLDEGGPKLALKFNGNITYMMDSFNFLIMGGDDMQTVCLGAINAGTNGVSTLGTLTQEELVIEFNYDNQTVGFSDSLPRVGAGSCGQFVKVTP